MAQSSTSRDAVAVATVFYTRSIETLEESKKHLAEQSALGALARGKVFSIAAEYGEAAASFATAVTLDPTLTEAAARLPLAQLKAGQNEKALVNATALAAREPEFMVQELMSDAKFSVLTILGEALLANHRVEQAKEAYSAAHKLSAKDSYAAGRLAQLSIATGNPKEAVALAGDFANNPRAAFRDLSAVIPLGIRSAALLPGLTAESLIANLRLAMPGRPILAEGMAQVAPLLWGSNEWCPDIAGEPVQ